MTLHTSRRLISVAEYHRMAEVGILTPDEKVELINGEILEKMSPLGSKHSGHVKWIHKLLQKLVGDEAIIGVQDPIILSDFSEPEPDVAILAPRDDFYIDQHPHTKDVWLVIEVADSSLERDRKMKLELYAKSKISTYWIVNLKEKQLEVYSKPNGNFFEEVDVLSNKDEVSIPVLDVKMIVGKLFKK